MIRIIKTTVFLLAAWLIAATGYETVTHKLDRLKSTQMQMSTVTADMREKQLDCLARNIYHEAGYEPFEGKVAVAQVTINRTENGAFPSDICRVVYQKNVVYEKVLCQFSWYCDQAALKKPLNKAVYTESMEVAKKVLLEGFRIDAVKNALYYHADYINPGWGKKPITKIGHHVFYN
jgi:spore germination cell wall hydrolase CwlJ-like protein